MNHYAPIIIDYDRDVLIDNIKHLYEKDISKWYLELMDLNKIQPKMFSELEEKFHSKITVTRLFVTPKHTFSIIHYDQAYKWALNIPIVGCEDNFNVWYKMKENATHYFSGTKDAQDLTYAANNSGAQLYKLIDVEEILQKVELKSPMIFDASTPHNVVTDNYLDLRVVLSIRFKSGKTKTHEEICKELGFLND